MKIHTSNVNSPADRRELVEVVVVGNVVAVVVVVVGNVVSVVQVVVRLAIVAGV